MAIAELGDLTIQTDQGPIHASNPSMHYDAVTDALTFWLNGTARPHLTEPANDFASILFDMTTGVAIGVRVDNFATYAVHKFPRLKLVAKFFAIEIRDPADTELFADRIVQRVQEVDESQFDEVKLILKTIVDVTGGFDDGSIPDRMVVR